MPQKLDDSDKMSRKTAWFCGIMLGQPKGSRYPLHLSRLFHALHTGTQSASTSLRLSFSVFLSSKIYLEIQLYFHSLRLVL